MKSEDLILLDFKIYSKAIAMKTAWYWWKYRQIGEWNKQRQQKQTT